MKDFQIQQNMKEGIIKIILVLLFHLMKWNTHQEFENPKEATVLKYQKAQKKLLMSQCICKFHFVFVQINKITR